MTGVSRPVEGGLPAGAAARLDGRDLPARVGWAIPVCTVDPDGFPHPALLSCGELVALDARRLWLALFRESRSLANLRRNGGLTLILVDAGLTCYVKARAAVAADPLPGFPHLAAIAAEVEAVLEDAPRPEHEGSARIIEGIRYAPGDPPGETLRSWEGILAALRGIRCG